jgi:hypothetical protein
MASKISGFLFSGESLFPNSSNHRKATEAKSLALSPKSKLALRTGQWEVYGWQRR